MSIRSRLPRDASSTASRNPKTARRNTGRFGIALLLVALFLAPCASARSVGGSAGLIPLPSPGNGLDLHAVWNADAYDNLDGGLQRGYATDSVLSLGFGLDTGALGAWRGGRLALRLQAIASTHPSDYAGDLQILSNLDASNRRGIAEFWYSQQIGGSLIRGGILNLNDFFDVDDAASLFANSSFGIVPSISANVPSSIYPDFGWGLMGRVGPADDDWQFGLFQGDPNNRASALSDGAMLIAERGWSDPGSGTRIGLGAWYRDVPETAGPPASDWGAYTNLEHALPGHPHAVAFVQLGASPGAENQVPGYLGAGLHFYRISAALSEVGIGLARAWIRGHAAETSVEATARFPVGSGFFLQPDLQYIFHPSGIHPNALVAGLRLHLMLF